MRKNSTSIRPFRSSNTSNTSRHPTDVAELLHLFLYSRMIAGASKSALCHILHLLLDIITKP